MRLRPDLVLVDPRTMNDAWGDMSGVERTAWYEEARQRGTLEGYVILAPSIEACLDGRRDGTRLVCIATTRRGRALCLHPSVA